MGVVHDLIARKGLDPEEIDFRLDARDFLVDLLLALLKRLEKLSERFGSELLVEVKAIRPVGFLPHFFRLLFARFKKPLLIRECIGGPGEVGVHFGRGNQESVKLLEKDVLQIGGWDFVPAGGADVFRAVDGNVHFLPASAENETRKEMNRPLCRLLPRPGDGPENLVALSPHLLGDGIRDEVALNIMNWDHNSSRHAALAAIAKAEGENGVVCKAALREVWMLLIKMLQLEPKRLIWRVFIQDFRNTRIRLAFACSMSLLLRGLPLLFGRLTTRQPKPFRNTQSCFANTAIFHAADKIEDVAPAFALAETVPAIFGEAHAKVRGIFSFMQWACSCETVAVAASLEVIGEMVMLQNLQDGNGFFYCLKIHIIS